MTHSRWYQVIGQFFHSHTYKVFFCIKWTWLTVLSFSFRVWISGFTCCRRLSTRSLIQMGPQGGPGGQNIHTSHTYTQSLCIFWKSAGLPQKISSAENINWGNLVRVTDRCVLLYYFAHLPASSSLSLSLSFFPSFASFCKIRIKHFLTLFNSSHTHANTDVLFWFWLNEAVKKVPDDGRFCSNVFTHHKAQRTQKIIMHCVNNLQGFHSESQNN